MSFCALHPTSSRCSKMAPSRWGLKCIYVSTPLYMRPSATSLIRSINGQKFLEFGSLRGSLGGGSRRTELKKRKGCRDSYHHDSAKTLPLRFSLPELRADTIFVIMTCHLTGSFVSIYGGILGASANKSNRIWCDPRHEPTFCISGCQATQFNAIFVRAEQNNRNEC